MAGAGIGKCVICGRDNQPLVNDICQDCTMDEFHAGLEQSPLKRGQRVHLLRFGMKDYTTVFEVVNDFAGGWHDKVLVEHCGDNGLPDGQEREISRSQMTAK